MNNFYKRCVGVMWIVLLCMSLGVLIGAGKEAKAAEKGVTFEGAAIRTDKQSAMRFLIEVQGADQVEHCGITISYGAKSITVSTENENYRKIYKVDKDKNCVQYAVTVYGIPEEAFENNFTVQGFIKDLDGNEIKTEEFKRNVQGVADAARYEYKDSAWTKMEDVKAAEVDDGATTVQEEDGSLTISSFNGDYNGVYLKLPEGTTASDYETIRMRVTAEEQFGVQLLDNDKKIVIKSNYPGYSLSEQTTQVYTITLDKVDANVTKTFDDGVYLKIMTLQNIGGNAAKHTPITIHWIKYDKKEDATETELASMKDTYADIFSYMGTCLTSKQMQDAVTMEFVKKHYNSFTLENEMKPEAILNYGYANLLSVEAAKEKGYVIPENYEETTVPELKFSDVDSALEIAYKSGLKMRGHTLLWHQQTPVNWFREGYKESGDVVTPAVMDARLEFYVRTVMKHVMEKEKDLTGKAGSLVYAWDVVNEYTHRLNNPTATSWVDVYGNMELEPTYVKKAYEFAYDMLKTYGVQDDVVLCYNDYNTYIEKENIVKLVKYINQSEPAKICSAVGMQSHLDASWPGADIYGKAVEAFLAAGLEVQITELDATINFNNKDAGLTDEDQATYVKSIVQMILDKNKARDKAVSPKGVTGLTLWGLYDAVSWRSSYSPLLFGKSLQDPKPSFYAFIEAAKG